MLIEQMVRRESGRARGRRAVSGGSVWLAAILLAAVAMAISMPRAQPAPGQDDAETAHLQATAEFHASHGGAVDTASGARWAAPGAYYAEKYGRSIAAGDARWASVGAYYAEKHARSATASSARYTALADYYAAELTGSR